MAKATNAAIRAEENKDSRDERNAALRSKLTAVKPFPAVVARVQAVASDPKRTVADVAEVVERDVAFAARMLRVVNSAAFGLAAQCKTVRHAVALLGTRRVATIATSTAALEMVEQTSVAGPLIAKHAVACAGLSRFLASYAGVSPDEAFTVGLLHDVGMLLVLQAGDALYEELVEQIGQGEPSSDEEIALLGFDHAELGAEALRSWSLPDPLPDIVALHHDWESAAAFGGTVAAMVAVVRVSDILAGRVVSRLTPEEGDLDALRNEPAVAHLGFAADELVRMWPQLRAAATESPYAESEGHATVPDVRPRISLNHLDGGGVPLTTYVALAPAAAANDTTAGDSERPAWIVPAAVAGGLAVLGAIAAALLG
jgi:HD-like signal output (HDOD) protein